MTPGPERLARRELWLIRHAESTWNALGRWQGQADPPLTAHGRVQAKALAASLAEAGIESIVASDLRRARATAAVLARALRIDPTWDARLRERDLGSWAGLTSDAIAARWPEELARLRARDLDVRPGGGESLRDVAARARVFFAELAAANGAARTAIVTHGGLIRAVGAVQPLANAQLVRTTLEAVLDGLAASAADAERR